MPENKIYRKCPNCGAYNLNRDYCSECGTIVNTLLRRKLEQKQRAKESLETQKIQHSNAITQFFTNAMNHSNPAVRILAKGLYSVWALVLMIGTAIAFIFAYVAA